MGWIYALIAIVLGSTRHSWRPAASAFQDQGAPGHPRVLWSAVKVRRAGAGAGAVITLVTLTLESHSHTSTRSTVPKF